ncbi:MAG: response regulator [Pedosphaera sp.]|nr:response regulator [Pedosphaera sp.]
MSRLPRKYQALVVDDFAEHCILLACAMRQTQWLQAVHSVTTGREAINYLVGNGGYADRQRFPFPDVVVTELDMPSLESQKLLLGLGVGLSYLPLLVVLTGSPCPKDRQAARRAGADAYFTKPERFCDLVVIAQTIEQLTLRADNCSEAGWRDGGREQRKQASRVTTFQ